MKKKFPIYLLLLMAATFLFSCNKDKDDDSSSTIVYTTSTSSALVAGFSLQADTNVMPMLDSVFFTINPDRGVIYNADSLPVGTDISKLKVKLTFKSAVGSAVFRIYDSENNFRDLTYNSTSSDTIDFRYGVTLTITSADRLKVKAYDVKVNVHKQVPDSISWPASARRNLPAAADNNLAQGTARLGDKFYNLMHTNEGYFFSTAQTPAGPWETRPVDWGFEPDVTSLAASTDALYVLDLNGHLHRSSDGTGWNDTGVQWRKLLGGYTNMVLGITADEPCFDEYPRRANHQPRPLPQGFPVEGTSQLITATNNWAVAPQAVMTGGKKADGSFCSEVWSFDGDSWAPIGNVKATMPALYGPTLFAYVTYKTASSTSYSKNKVVTWMVMGGRLADGKFNRNTYISTNQGITWTQAANTLAIAPDMPDFYGAQAFVVDATINANHVRRRVAQPVNQWQCPYIYLVGGYGSNAQLHNSVWTGVLNRALQKPLY